MRTTVNLDEDVLQIARAYSESRCIALGKALSELVKKGAAASVPTRLVDGFVIFDLPPSGTKITSESVKQILESDLDDLLSTRR